MTFSHLLLKGGCIHRTSPCQFSRKFIALSNSGYCFSAKLVRVSNTRVLAGSNGRSKRSKMAGFWSSGFFSLLSMMAPNWACSITEDKASILSSNDCDASKIPSSWRRIRRCCSCNTSFAMTNSLALCNVVWR